ncbi:hypothetical protein [Cereibacter changlensis]|uniref:hypothetical protein n=1 Tax=Cereibacter changlensis TaxID=402884 RepID=UPI0040336ABE
MRIALLHLLGQFRKSESSPWSQARSTAASRCGVRPEATVSVQIWRTPVIPPAASPVAWAWVSVLSCSGRP